MTIVTERAEIEARARVTGRMRPLRVEGRTVHQVAMPWHWGYAGAGPGDMANDLLAISGEPNVSIQESKAFTCDVRAGRRRGFQHRAGSPGAAPSPLGAGSRRGRSVGREPQEGGRVSTSAPPTEIAIHQVGAQRMGFFTDTSVCIGCKACEVACKQWNDLPADGATFTKGSSYDHTGELSASTWRHVRFIELLEPSPALKAEAEQALSRGAGGSLPAIPAVGTARGSGGFPGPAGGERRLGRTGHRRARRRRGGQDGRLGVHVRRVQALHQRRLPGRLPDRRADPHRASDGRAAARCLQRLRLLRPRLPVRGRRPRPDRRPRGQVHALL